MAAPEPRGAERLPTEAAIVLPGVPVLVVAVSRARRAPAGTKTVHWGQRVPWGFPFDARARCGPVPERNKKTSITRRKMFLNS